MSTNTNYFVTLNGITILDNTTKERAISKSNSLVDSGIEVHRVGLGKYRMKNGLKEYSLLPIMFYIN